MRILYLHGLGSGAESRTATTLREMLKGHEVLAPEIPIRPKDAYKFLQSFSNENIDLVVGTSLGGFYCLLIPGVKRIIINPALFADYDIRNRIGLGEQPFFSVRKDGRTSYNLDESFIAELSELRRIVYGNLNGKEKDNTYALFGTEDELLDHYKDFRNIFKKEHASRFEGGHRLEPKQVHEVLAPMIRKLLEI